MAPPLLFALLALVLSVQSMPQLGSEAPSNSRSMLMGTLPVIEWKRAVAWRPWRQRRWQGEEGWDVDKRAATPGVLSLPVVHVRRPQLHKRDDDGAVNVSLTSRADVAYYVKLSVGNPPQPVSVQLDTGSFELWVNPDCSRLTSTDASFCRAGGQYDPSQSSTASETGLQSSLRYGIGAANITYVEDSIGFPGAGGTMQKVRFGVAVSSMDQFSGILGVGYGKGTAIPYPSFMDQLAAQRVTETKTLGVALGSKDEAGGAVAFGGVDAAKFSGRLAALPIIPAGESPDKVPRYWVRLESISHSPPDGPAARLSDRAMPVFLDTGATLSLLPSRVVEAMAAALGSSGAVQGGLFAVDCGLAGRDDGAFSFRFNGVTIFVPYSEMIRQLPGGRGQSGLCYLGVMPSDRFALLGDTFLRSAYVVFDLDRNMAYMARYSNCGSTVQAIPRNARLKGMPGMCSEPGVAKGRLTSADDATSAAAGPDPDSKSLAAVVAVVAGLLLWGAV